MIHMLLYSTTEILKIYLQLQTFDLAMSYCALELESLIESESCLHIIHRKEIDQIIKDIIFSKKEIAIVAYEQDLLQTLIFYD